MMRKSLFCRGGMGRKKEVVYEDAYFCGIGDMRNMIRMREIRAWLENL